MNGRILLDRSLLDWDWWDDNNALKLWIYILLRANWQDESWHGEVIPRGAFVTSYEKLSSDTKLTTMQVRTSLKKLEKTGEISKNVTSKYQIITVEKYDFYQDFDTVDNRQITNKQQTNNRQITTNEERNKKNKRNKDITSSTLDEPAARIIAYLNEKAGKNYSPDTKITQRLISARLKKYTEQDFYKVIDNQVERWQNDERMADYIRPQTLFAEANFESYLNAPASKAQKDNEREQKNIETAKANIAELETRIAYCQKQYEQLSDREGKLAMRDKIALYEEQLKRNKEYLERHERGG